MATGGPRLSIAYLPSARLGKKGDGIQASSSSTKDFANCLRQIKLDKRILNEHHFFTLIRCEAFEKFPALRQAPHPMSAAL